MAIGVLTDDEYEAELARLNPKVKRAEVVQKAPHKGRGEGTPNVPESLRKIIGEEAAINGRAAAMDIAKDFGLSTSSVSAYANGATSTATYNTPVKSLIGHINRSRERATKRASKTLNQALSAITQDKLDYSDAKDLSSIAKDMSVIIKNLEPPAEVRDEKQSPQFVIFAPQFRKEESFEVIDVKE